MYCLLSFALQSNVNHVGSNLKPRSNTSHRPHQSPATRIRRQGSYHRQKQPRISSLQPRQGYYKDEANKLKRTKKNSTRRTKPKRREGLDRPVRREMASGCYRVGYYHTASMGLISIRTKEATMSTYTRFFLVGFGVSMISLSQQKVRYKRNSKDH